ncbi:MAG: aspartate aminotransferase family protein [Bacteroidetes bacterium]|nr:aspartate aminotransferase family protein [Bacteroidota bacterium]
MTGRSANFLRHVAQTSDAPISIEVDRVEGSYIYDKEGKEYLDLIAGISVANLGHANPKVQKAITDQLENYSHVMVYGEFILEPQVDLATRLAQLLPDKLDTTYFVNSGSEAVEGALKLAKRYTGRAEIISFNNAYHGSTHGALSIMGNDFYKSAFTPLLPDTRIIEFNSKNDLKEITEKTAAVIIEPVQGEAGVRIADNEFLDALRAKCDATKTLLIFDDIQAGMGRTGKLFTFEHYDIIPDIITLAKAFGGGLPLGAFISSNKIMSCLQKDPPLGHITTFGGNPLSCAAGLAFVNELLDTAIMDGVAGKAQLFEDNLNHPAIKEIRNKGLLMAVEFDSFEFNKKVIDECIANGVIVDWFLFADSSLRISPPLNISDEDITKACEILSNAIENIN